MSDAHSGAATITFLLLPKFTLMAFAAAMEPLRLANYVSERALYRWVLVSRAGGSEVASAGFGVSVDHSLATVPDPATLVVCGGIDAHWYDDRGTLAWLRRIAARGAVIGSICTGSHVLARAGLLDGYACTTHWENLHGLSESFPRLRVTDALFTIDRNRFTCAGGTAATDMMLWRIARDHGDALALKVAEELLHDSIRRGETSQPRAKAANTVERAELVAAIKLMHETIEDPLDLLTLSTRLGQSRRNIERLFKKHMNCSPARYYLDLRLRRARQLLWQTNMSVTEVAVSCGFVSATHFSKCYRDHFGASPRADQSSRRRPFSLAGLPVTAAPVEAEPKP